MNEKGLLNRKYSNILIIGKTGSGKSNVVNNIVDILIDRYKKDKIKLVIFSKTYDIDKVLKNIVSKYECDCYKDLYDGNKFIPNKYLELEGLDDDIKQIEKILKRKLTKEEIEELKEELRPYTIIIYDDIGNMLRKDNNISNFIVKSRHYKICNIMSNQYYNDIEKKIRENCNIVCLMQNISPERLKDIYDDIDIGVDKKLFLEIYKDATWNEYNFLSINVNKGELYKNLDYKYEII